jgi:hypothetical protein
VMPAMIDFLAGMLRALGPLVRNPLLWTIAIGIVVQAIAMRSFGSGANDLLGVQCWRMLPATLYQINMRVLAPSLIGVRPTEWVNESRILSCLMLGGLLALCAFILRQRRASWRGEVATVLLLAAVFSTWVLYLGRPTIFGGFRSKPWRVEMNGMRYALGVLRQLAGGGVRLLGPAARSQTQGAPPGVAVVVIRRNPELSEYRTRSQC